ncbi:hypothetical protein HMPREF1121_00146 [Porphyromonas sp. KLE 1280]|nr:hypothetical protein HMPREF1121_00146 [Porphyromonas sp. KLE 1280]
MSELTIQSKTNKKAGTFKRLALARSLMQDGFRGERLPRKPSHMERQFPTVL